MFTSYAFNQAENSPQDYYWFQNAFSEEELTRLYDLLESLRYQDATTIGNQDEKISEVRSSKIKWIPQTNNWQWLYEKLFNMIEEANGTLWNFDLFGTNEFIQYTEYLASDQGHYDWHQDIGPGGPSLRKVSLVVQLTEAEEYEGGDLQIWPGGNIWTVPKGKGNVAIFPSYMMHRVTPMTSGVRKSLVLWAGGQHYK
jgi:PKHD-type hydroxylase